MEQKFICEKCSKEFKSARALGQHKGWCLNPDRKPNSLDSHKPNCECCMCVAKRRAEKPWNYGLTKETSSSVAAGAKKNSEFRSGKTYEEIYGEEEGARLRKLRAIESAERPQSDEKRRKVSLLFINKPKSKEHKQKLSDNWDVNHSVESIQQAGISVKASGYQRGYFKSVKNNTNLWYQSSYEKDAFQRLEDDPEVISFNRCSFKVPYIFEGKNRRHVPDISVKRVGKVDLIVEVKPIKLKNDLENVAKREVCMGYCTKNNLDYEMWTEQDLPNISKTNYYDPTKNR